MTELWPIPRKSVKSGGQDLLYAEDILRHEPFCDFMKIQCAILDCKDDVCLLGYLEHLQRHPIESLSDGKSWRLPFTFEDGKDKKWSPKKLTAFNETFFDVGMVKDNLVYRWIFFLGLPDQAKNYVYHASIKMDSGEPMKFFGQVRSMAETIDEVMNGETFMFHINTAKRAMNQDSKVIDFSIKIRCLKDEAKDDDAESGIDD